MAENNIPDNMSDYVEYLQHRFDGENPTGQNLSDLFNEDVSDSNWEKTEAHLNRLHSEDTRSVIEQLMSTPVGRLAMARMSAKAQEYIKDIIEPDAERITMEQRIQLSAVLNVFAEMFSFLGANTDFFERGVMGGQEKA